MADVIAEAPISDQIEAANLSINQEHLDSIAKSIVTNRGRYAKYQAYYDGQHNVQLTKRAEKYLQASGLPYAHNVCDIVCDKLTNRLEIESITFQTTLSDDEEVNADNDKLLNQWFNTVWQDNKGSLASNIAHKQAVRKGDAYAVAWLDPSEGIRITYNMPEHATVKYRDDDPTRPEYIAKMWKEHGRDRMNVYYANRVEKYFRATTNGRWGIWLDEGETVWPMPWRRPDSVSSDGSVTLGAPLGVAMAHLRNKVDGRPMGVSEIHKVLPMQDALNKRLVDLDLVSDNQGYQQRYAIGVERNSTLRNFPGSLWRTTNKDAKFGAFPPGDLSQILLAIQQQMQHIAVMTDTPMHDLLQSRATSGEAMKTADAGLAEKANDRAETFGDAWAHVAMMVVTLGIDHGLLPDELRELELDQVTATVNWKDPETRNEESYWRVQESKDRLGVSKNTILREAGYDPSREAEHRTSEREAANMEAMRAFDAGQVDVS